MNDLISRQMAIGFIHNLYPSPPFLRINRKLWEKKYKPYIEVENIIEKLPSAQKVGYWIDNHDDTILCSHCGTWFHKDDRYSYMRYCPYCNAEMAENKEANKK